MEKELPDSTSSPQQVSLKRIAVVLLAFALPIVIISGGTGLYAGRSREREDRNVLAEKAAADINIFIQDRTKNEAAFTGIKARPQTASPGVVAIEGYVADDSHRALVTVVISSWIGEQHLTCGLRFFIRIGTEEQIEFVNRTRSKAHNTGVQTESETPIR